MAKYAITQSEINIAIGDKAPNVYFAELLAQCNGGPQKYGGISDLQTLQKNLAMNCVPAGMELRTLDDYDAFLEERRRLMAGKVREWYSIL